MNTKFSELTLDRIELFNTILADLGTLKLFENPDLLIDKESLSSRHITFAVYIKDKMTVPITIMIEEDSIRLDICNLPETFEWSKSQIETSRQKTIHFFKNLLTSYILIEACGSIYGKSRMYMFNENGNLIDKFILRGFIHSYSGWNCDKKLYFPIY